MATKKRLIFTLLYSDGYFCQSRNFRCQKVGDYDWLFNNYKFSKIAGFLDELIVINVNPIDESYQNFLNIVKRIVENVFIPVTIGGGIINLERAIDCFKNGADKVALNSSVRNNKDIVSQIVNHFGSQSVVASVDYKIINGEAWVYDWNHKKAIQGLDIKSYLNLLIELEFGEILLNSVDKDGTGFGFDIDTFKKVSSNCSQPLIAMGGAGKYEHFIDLYNSVDVDAAATANLLNFISNAIPNARMNLLQEGIKLAKF
jgi:cyclase|tara:strand:+ start:2155 stop:2928 length:774 start_codon:yes stop_codon:yes gene_type:complete